MVFSATEKFEGRMGCIQRGKLKIYGFDFDLGNICCVEFSLQIGKNMYIVLISNKKLPVLIAKYVV